MSAANHAFHDGFDKNGRKINNNGGDEIDYMYDDDGNIISSTAVEIQYSKTSERDFRIYGLKIEATGGGLYDPTWDLFGGAVSFGKFFSGLKLLFGVKASRNLTKSQIKSINSLKKQISIHQQKLNAYQSNPFKFDNKGFLRNAPNDAIRQKIIQSRINHLQKEINTFQSNINKILNN